MSPMDRAIDLASRGYTIDDIRAALLEECEEAADAAEQIIQANDRRECIREQNDEWDR